VQTHGLTVGNPDNGIYGNYRAKITSTSDSTNSGRVKVYIPQLMVEQEDQSIWAEPAFEFGGSVEGAAVEYGSFKVPPVGAYVWIFFEGGNPSLPYYFAGLTLAKGDDARTISEVAAEQSENVFVVLKTPKGHIIYISDNNDYIRLVTNGKNSFEINDTDKFIELKTANQHYVKIDDATNNIELKTAGGQSAKFDDLSNKIEMLTSGGQRITMGQDGVEIDGKTSDLKGCITGGSKCHFNGLDHADISQNVTASHG